MARAVGKIFDAVIVGAGYAGMAAAAQMPGRNLLLLERFESVSAKQRASLGFWIPLGAEIEAREGDLHLKDLELTVEEGIRQRLTRLEICGNRERVVLRLAQPLLVLNESRLKAALLRLLKGSGVEVQTGVTVRSVEDAGKFLRVRADQDYRAKFVIGADGAHGVVAQGLELRREKSAILFAREIELDHLDLPPDTLHLQIDDARHLFVAYPCQDRYAAFLLKVVSARETPADLDRLLLDRTDRLGSGRVLAGRSALVHLHAAASTAHRGGVVLAGDSLSTYGFSSITGALAMGALAGSAVHRTLAGSVYALPDYDRSWRKVAEHDWVERLRYLAPLLARLNTSRLDRLLQAAKGFGPTEQPLSLALLWRLPAILLNLVM